MYTFYFKMQGRIGVFFLKKDSLELSYLDMVVLHRA